jgi:hypothetical protein
MSNVVNLTDFKEANRVKVKVKETTTTEEHPLYTVMDDLLDTVEDNECEAIVILVKDGKLLTATTHQDTEELLDMLCTAMAEIKGELE